MKIKNSKQNSPRCVTSGTILFAYAPLKRHQAYIGLDVYAIKVIFTGENIDIVGTRQNRLEEAVGFKAVGSNEYPHCMFKAKLRKLCLPL